MPQKRQAKAPDAVAKPTVHTERIERRIDPYPSAPTDPHERQEWMRRRNARISRSISPGVNGSAGNLRPLFAGGFPRLYSAKVTGER